MNIAPRKFLYAVVNNRVTAAKIPANAQIAFEFIRDDSGTLRAAN
jgi:hypothetical protein